MQPNVLFTIVTVGVVWAGVVAYVVIDQSRTIRHISDLAHRDRVDSRIRYLEIMKEQRLEYQAICESYCRQEGKVYVTPVTLAEGVAGIKQARPDPPKHAFRMKPPPPNIENSPPPRVGQAPVKDPRA